VWSLGAQPVLESESVTRCIRTRVVIVDDDRSLLRGLELGLASYEPVAAQSATEALTLVQHCRPELLITDYLMPNISGAELIAQARAHQPAIKVILLTGHDRILEHEPSLAGERRLKKPCGLEQIRDAVLDLIGPPSRESAPLS
jgi:DNA-binding NtrC family response regulator